MSCTQFFKGACAALLLTALGVGQQAQAMDVIVADPEASAIIAAGKMLAGEEAQANPDGTAGTVLVRHYYRVTGWSISGTAGPDNAGNKVYVLSVEDEPSLHEETAAGKQTRLRDQKDAIDQQMSLLQFELAALAEEFRQAQAQGADVSGIKATFDQKRAELLGAAQQRQDVQRQLNGGSSADPGAANPAPTGEPQQPSQAELARRAEIERLERDAQEEDARARERRARAAALRSGQTQP